MKQNVGRSDKYVRFMLGLTFISNIFVLDLSIGGNFVLLAIGLSLFFSAFTGYCFLYDLLKINTTGSKVAESEEKAEAASE